MTTSQMKYLAIGGGVLVLFLLMRGSGGGGMSGATLTATTLANSQATNIQLSQINAARDAVAQQAATARVQMLAAIFTANSAGAPTIAAQAINSANITTKAVLDNAALYQSSMAATDLAKTLANANVDLGKYQIDAQKYIADVDSKTQIKLGQYAKDINNTNQKFSLAKQMDNNGAKFLTNYFGGGKIGGMF